MQAIHLWNAHTLLFKSLGLVRFLFLVFYPQQGNNCILTKCTIVKYYYNLKNVQFYMYRKESSKEQDLFGIEF